MTAPIALNQFGLTGGLFALILAPVRRRGVLGRLLLLLACPLPVAIVGGGLYLAGWSTSTNLADILPHGGLGDAIQIAIVLCLIACPVLFLAGLAATARTLGEAIQKRNASPVWAETLLLLAYLAVLVAAGMVVLKNS